MPESETSIPTKTLDLYVRSLAPNGSTANLDGILNSLAQLETKGHIAEYLVHVWGRQVRPATADRSAVSTDINDRLTAFRAWAERADMTLEPFFQTRDVEVSMTGQAYTVVDLPVMTIAEYEDENLTFVTPCADGDTLYTVHDRLEALATAGSGAPTEAGAHPSPATPGGGPDDL